MNRWPIILASLSLFACGEETQLYDAPYQEYEDETVTVIGGDEAVPVATGTTEGECLQISDETCTPIDREGKYCKTDSGPVDIVVVDGEVQQVVCYEDTSDDGPNRVLDSEAGDVEVAQMENGAVVTFDPSTDGVPIEGDIVVDGNDVTLYGNGPDKTIIDGNVRITGNNARVRGIRVTGNVTIDLNTASFVLSVVEGNLVIKYNNCLAAENDVFGNLVNDGNNTILVGNDIGGSLEGSGSGAICQDNRGFEDVNGDLIVTDDEIGDPIDC